MADYNAMELMISVAARELEDGASVAVGGPSTMMAANLISMERMISMG